MEKSALEAPEISLGETLARTAEHLASLVQQRDKVKSLRLDSAERLNALRWQLAGQYPNFDVEAPPQIDSELEHKLALSTLIHDKCRRDEDKVDQEIWTLRNDWFNWISMEVGRLVTVKSTNPNHPAITVRDRFIPEVSGKIRHAYSPTFRFDLEPDKASQNRLRISRRSMCVVTPIEVGRREPLIIIEHGNTLGQK